MDQHLPPSSPPELTPDPNPEPAPAVTPEPVSDLARASTPEAVAADVAVALRGRAARQQAEDAADASAKTQRWRGYGDLPGSEAVEEEPTTTVGVEQPTQQRPRGRLVPILVGIVALAGIGYAVFGRGQRAEQPANPVAPMAPQAAAPSITPPTTLPTTVGPAAADTQAQQVASLTARVATLEAALGNSARLQDVAKRIDTLESKSADASSVLALSERVNVLERTARTAIAEQGARIGQMLAVAQWREAVASGRPYVLELESVKALSARSGLGLVLDDPRVTAHAASGIATFVDLRDRFDDTAARVMRSGAVPQGVGGWLARSFDRMLSLMTIRRVDGLVEGNTPSAILARAGAQLRNSNLAACVTELEALTGPAADAAKLWLDEARARVAAEAAVNEASIKTIAALATDAAKSEP
jgi:hypothetical protein